MTDKLNAAIQDIAAKHGVVLSKDDPILILQTMNEKLFEDNRMAQQEMLAKYKEEIENITFQWEDKAKETAEKILNVALAGSKEATLRLFLESTNEPIQHIKKMMDLLVQAHHLTLQTQQFTRLVLLLASVIFTGSVLTLCVYYFK